jgi:hypothetical protein
MRTTFVTRRLFLFPSRYRPVHSPVYGARDPDVDQMGTLRTRHGWWQRSGYGRLDDAIGEGRMKAHALIPSPLWFAWGLALVLAALPFLFVAIPPLADAPGHLGQMAIAAAGADSPLRQYYGFHWGVKLNLGTDLLVEALRHMLGLERAFWLVCAAIPVLTVAAIIALARATGRTAAAASFALPFAYSWPFGFGFLNYTLGMALALLAFALWLRLADRPRRREALFWAIIPALTICHATGGGLLPVLIVADGAARHLWPRPGRAAIGAFLATVRPVLAAIPPIALAHVAGPGEGFDASWPINSKVNGIVQALRDQNRPLDIASVAIVIAVPLIGFAVGARYRRTGAAAILALLALFIAMPSELNGSSYNDMRFVPPLAILALTLQDWSLVARRRAMSVLAAGFALFAVRMAVTTEGFAAYARSYAAEGHALSHIAPGSRVLMLVTHECGARWHWRTDRLEHFPVMATVERDAWTNGMWDVPAIHLLQISYRPSPLFYQDPSNYVWPATCIDASSAADRRTIAQAAPLLPLDRVDYLWMVQAKLPHGPWDKRIVPVWSAGGSTLYRTRSPG